MALVLADRVRETTTTAGTGTITLLGAVPSCQSFAVVGNGNTTYYTIVAYTGTEWEVGIGTYTSSGTTLSRDTVLSSSNGGSLVNFSAGTKDVFVDYPASKAVYEDASDIVTGYAITGGTINGTTVGATTPAAGTFTTLTAQTEVLKGTGQNLLLQSQTFSNAIWSKQSSVTVTSNTTVAPDSTTTASTITADADLGIYQSIASIIGLPYTQSVYVKAGTATAIMFRDDSGAGRHIVFNPSTGVITSTAGTLISSGSQSFGNGWYRYYFSYLADTTQVRGIVRPNSSGTAQTFIVWGAQTELASPAGTYTVTTTTAVYGTPTLSFSGVSTIGLQSDGSLYVSPAGTGALQAQATTSSATGGNARGANAVDWQTLRDGATRVASGLASVISGGRYNQASNTDSVVAGGQGAINTSNSGVVGGGYQSSNTASNQGVLVGGYQNNLAGSWGVIGGGYANSAQGAYNIIVGGYTNSATSASAVTTQSATMNGTTAVTLAASNASIKVGQLITGTNITTFPATYVAAISGTSLTLSQVASGSSTSTLSFFTPHGVVVGGGNNQATGSYSFIGGGGDAGTAGNRNVASGDWSTVAGGAKNTASGLYSFVGGGTPNTASGAYSGITSGSSNTATGAGGFIGAGVSNVVNGTYSAIMGGYQGTTRGIGGYHAFPATINPLGFTVGACQSGLLVIARETTDATATRLTSDATTTGGTTNQVILPNNSAYYFKGSVIANVTGAANGAAWAFEGAIMRGANAGSTVLIGTPAINRVASTSGASAWTIALTADTTNGGLAVTVTGATSTTIRWVSSISTTEVTF